jgi:endonuclease YncB( thermonuclease family)
MSKKYYKLTIFILIITIVLLIIYFKSMQTADTASVNITHTKPATSVNDSLVEKNALTEKRQFDSFEILKVVDGDTIKIKVPELPVQLQKISIRILGIDTPESTYRAKCQAEKTLALKVKEYLKNKVLMSDDVSLNIKGYGKYGGRILADVYLDGISVAEDLVSKDYAIPYDGGKKSNPWCD